MLVYWSRSLRAQPRQNMLKIINLKLVKYPIMAGHGNAQAGSYKVIIFKNTCDFGPLLVLFCSLVHSAHKEINCFCHCTL